MRACFRNAVWWTRQSGDLNFLACPRLGIVESTLRFLGSGLTPMLFADGQHCRLSDSLIRVEPCPDASHSDLEIVIRCVISLAPVGFTCPHSNTPNAARGRLELTFSEIESGGRDIRIAEGLRTVMEHSKGRYPH